MSDARIHIQGGDLERDLRAHMDGILSTIQSHIDRKKQSPSARTAILDLVTAGPDGALRILDEMLLCDPGAAANLAIQTLRWLEGMDGRQELRVIAADIARQAIAKLLSTGS